MAYLRYITAGTVVCSILASKTHVAPVKTELSIPRLELQGAVLATRLGNALLKELPLTIDDGVYYWTDSSTVLRYLKNETKRFKPFVANRVADILDSSTQEQWNYIHTSLNPADSCSRGLSASALIEEPSWLHGPNFLHYDKGEWPSQPNMQPIGLDDEDPEIKRAMTIMTLGGSKVQALSWDTVLSNSDITSLVDPAKFSSWNKLCRHTAWIFRAVRNFAAAVSRLGISQSKGPELTANELDQTLLYWTQQAQQDGFAAESECLRSGDILPSKSKLLPLKPYYDGRHLRVGGRLRKARIPLEAKYQLLLPASQRITELLFEDAHSKLAHCGREHLIANIRQRFWPLNARSLAKRTIARCLDCHRRRIKPGVPIMADLPSCRLDIHAGAFHSTGVDYFGPMMVKVRRSSVKVWGCLFTCLTVRAVHLDLVGSLSTDDFILCLRRFIGRTGSPAHIYSDNGTNFKGAKTELETALQELDQNQICSTLAAHSIGWHFIPPHAPHFGGAWERLVRSVKTALKTVLKEQYVTETVLRTALIEVEGVINSRPLTHNSPDVSDFAPLTPNHFLLGVPTIL